MDVMAKLRGDGRVAVEFELWNHRDQLVANRDFGHASIRRVRLLGVLDSNVMDPERDEAVVGYIALEKLDLIIDRGELKPREIDGIVVDL